MRVALKWITANAEEQIVHIARVSNPKAQDTHHNPSRLLRYLVSHAHWSPFEMASVCMEIETTRDIARQILRHRSFSFQEFSQRYEIVTLLGDMIFRDCRMQDDKNRQNSIPTNNVPLQMWWSDAQAEVMALVTKRYTEAIERGIAKEVARAILPEGLTASRLYMSGTVRSWLHYCALRTMEGTQAEHRDVAAAILEVMRVEMPTIFSVQAIKHLQELLKQCPPPVKTPLKSNTHPTVKKLSLHCVRYFRDRAALIWRRWF